MIVFLDCEPETHKVWRRASQMFAQGVPGVKHVCTAEEFVNERPFPGKIDGVVHFHYHGAAKEAIDICRRMNWPHYWIEGAYVARDRYFRITKNRNQAKPGAGSALRFPAVFENVPVRPWRPGGRKKILFCVAAQDMADFDPNVRSWESDARDYLLSVRRNGDVVFRDRDSKTPFAQDLQDAECLISYNSNAAVEALLQGVPVIVSQESVCYKFSRWNLLNLWRGDRQPLWDLIAGNQFTMEEMANGTAWGMVK